MRAQQDFSTREEVGRQKGSGTGLGALTRPNTAHSELPECETFGAMGPITKYLKKLFPLV